MRLELTIDSDNDACTTREDLCDIVSRFVPKLRLAGTGSKHAIRDINGNTVGWYRVTGDEHVDEEEGDESEDNEG